MSNANMSFGKKTPTWKTYTTSKPLFISKQVQIVNLKEFVIIILDKNRKIFGIYMAIWEQKNGYWLCQKNSDQCPEKRPKQSLDRGFIIW